MACFIDTSVSRPSGHLRTNVVVAISSSRLDEDSWSFCEHRFDAFARNISSESRWPPNIFPSESPGQALTISRGSYRRPDLWRQHMAPKRASMSYRFVRYPPGPTDKYGNTTSDNHCKSSRSFSQFGRAVRSS